MWGARTSEGVHHCLQRPHDLLAEQWEVILGEEGLQVLPLQTVAQMVGQAHHLGEERLLEQGEGRLRRRPTLALHYSSHPARVQEPGQQLRHLHQMETRAAARAGVMGRGVSPHPWRPGPQGGSTAILKQVILQLNWHEDLNPTIPLPSRRSRVGRARPQGPAPIPQSPDTATLLSRSTLTLRFTAATCNPVASEHSGHVAGWSRALTRSLGTAVS